MPRPEDKPHPHDPDYEKPGKGLGRDKDKDKPDQELPDPGQQPHPDNTLPGDLETPAEGEDDEIDETGASRR